MDFVVALKRLAHIEGLSVGLQVSITDIIKAHRHIDITNKASREQEIK